MEGISIFVAWSSSEFMEYSTILFGSLILLGCKEGVYLLANRQPGRRFWCFFSLSLAVRRFGRFGGFLVGIEVFVPRTKLWMDKEGMCY